MSYLLFMDESGHHRGDGYEVRGGIALEMEKVWTFTRQMRGLEGKCFGTMLSHHGSELKAIKLLERKRVRLASSRNQIDEQERRKLCQEYLGQSRNNIKPTLTHGVAYSQAGINFVGELLQLIQNNAGQIFATIVPARHNTPPQKIERSFVRRDIRYLLGAYASFLEDKGFGGALVLDETDRADDKRFLKRLETYFSITAEGKSRSRLVLPTPLFTGSEMSYPVQAADIVCYLISQTFRLPQMELPRREDLPVEWIALLTKLRYEYRRTLKSGELKDHYSIIYVEKPWGA